MLKACPSKTLAVDWTLDYKPWFTSATQIKRNTRPDRLDKDVFIVLAGVTSFYKYKVAML